MIILHEFGEYLHKYVWLGASLCEQNSPKGQDQLIFPNPVWHDAWMTMFVVNHLMVCVALSSLLCKVVFAVSM